MDIIPVPPSDFCRSLRLFDADLFPRFCRHQKVWQIWWHDPKTGSCHHVLNWVNPDGSYRDLSLGVLNILSANRYFAEHPEELIRKVVVPIESAFDKSRKREDDDIAYLAKDKTLQRKFSETVEKVRSVPWNEWTSPRRFTSKDGVKGIIVPHPSMLNSVKPTDGECDEIIKRGKENEDL